MPITLEHMASSLDDVADYLDRQAANRREQAKHTVRKALQRELIGEARGIELASEIVRSTTIDQDGVTAAARELLGRMDGRAAAGFATPAKDELEALRGALSKLDERQ